MARRNQSRRRRTYGRRQHEVRERRPGEAPDGTWLDEVDAQSDDWHASDVGDELSGARSTPVSYRADG